MNRQSAQNTGEAGIIDDCKHKSGNDAATGRLTKSYKVGYRYYITAIYGAVLSTSYAVSACPYSSRGRGRQAGKRKRKERASSRQALGPCDAVKIQPLLILFLVPHWAGWDR